MMPFIEFGISCSNFLFYSLVNGGNVKKNVD